MRTTEERGVMKLDIYRSGGWTGERAEDGERGRRELRKIEEREAI